MDTIQILLLIILGLSTVLLTVVGIQLIMVLAEGRRTLQNINKIIHGLDSLGIGLNHGVGEMVGFINGFRTVMKALDVATRKKNEPAKSSHQ